jgi:hypothetical protein
LVSNDTSDGWLVRETGIKCFGFKTSRLKYLKMQKNLKALGCQSQLQTSYEAVLTNFETLAVLNTEWKSENLWNNRFRTITCGEFFGEKSFIFLM